MDVVRDGDERVGLSHERRSRIQISAGLALFSDICGFHGPLVPLMCVTVVQSAIMPWKA